MPLGDRPGERPLELARAYVPELDRAADSDEALALRRERERVQRRRTGQRGELLCRGRVPDDDRPLESPHRDEPSVPAEGGCVDVSPARSTTRSCDCASASRSAEAACWVCATFAACTASFSPSAGSVASAATADAASLRDSAASALVEALLV